MFDEDGFYVRLANRALDEVPWHRRIRRRGHGLCVCLNKLSQGLDPATYAKLIQTPVRAGLLRLGFPGSSPKSSALPRHSASSRSSEDSRPRIFLRHCAS